MTAPPSNMTAQPSDDEARPDVLAELTADQPELTDDQPVLIEDPQALKALAHPMRQQLLKLLRQLGPSTVTSLAQHLSADAGLVSYHARELAKYGFIVEVPELAKNRRERWWRMARANFSFTSGDFVAPERRALADAAAAQVVMGQFEALRRYNETSGHWSQEWVDAATNSTTYLRLTPAELRELTGELEAVLLRWGALGQAGPDGTPPDDGREHVMVFYHAFPEEI